MTTPHYDAAHARLDEILDRVRSGEEVVIDEAGRPVAKVVPLRRSEPRRLGLLRDRITIADDFDEADPEIERRFGLAP
ncbi:type II toxin-antitoxin system Phd/YefM family antitoxin [Allonocardiopsis opalescens]|uniref:Prevent-host-death family protein n=1 Tax=Allonocardiopsis opalescens TaxID=1144618 RepID=A0A2T0PW43_9ACTN|nr:type II toxin-antitoxin system prevent-host-death family antitoxin [Allonocardiopsis opalescens]PRX95650.1 prevent-host-death family protein [Allonocardiopsis opalescens]